MIACVDLHNDHNVYVYKTGGSELQLVGKQKGDQNKIHDVAFSQKEGCTRFATAGSKHMYFWNAAENGLDKKKGIYDGAPMTSFSCATWDADGNCYTGGANSLVYCWDAEERKCTGTIKAHAGGFICAIRYVDGSLWSGGKDGNVHCIDLASKQSTRCIEFGSLVRAVDCFNGNLLVGLRDGTIWHRPSDGGEGKAIMSSHNDGEVWGLDILDGKVWTSGDDNQVICWDPTKRAKEGGCKITDEDGKPRRGKASTLSHLPPSQQSRALCSSTWFVVVATNDGKVRCYKKGEWD
jgi:WD40 repeat protein